jgi:ubiquinone/menaquinone biosynthesis C-methylase UbiE
MKLDEEKKSRFSEKMTSVLNYGSLNLGLAIGYRLMIFDRLAGLEKAVTVEEAAQEVGLDQRYLREWLGIMISGGVIEAKEGEDGQIRYFLPPEHAAFLTRDSGDLNLGVYTQEIPLLTTCSLEGVIKGFNTGDGVSYDCYPKFQAFMNELSEQKQQKTLVDVFLPHVDGGAILNKLKQGIDVLDLGCGEGLAVVILAQAFPQSRFTGVDICGPAIAKAVKRAETAGLKNAAFLETDAARFDSDPAWADRFDYVIAFDAIHDQTRPMNALKSVLHALKPGGVFSMVDIAASSNPLENVSHPLAPFLYAVSLMHCMPVGLVDGGAGLGMMWGRQTAVRMLKEAGFPSVDVVEMPEDPFNLHFFCRK